MKVSFFSTCLVDNLFPQVGIDTVTLLEKLGCSVVFNRKQTCCGQPLANSGYHQKAKKSMRLLIETMLSDEVDYVVAPSGSCVLQISEYPHFFQDEPQVLAQAEKLVAKTRELTDFIVNVLNKDKVDARLNAKAAYHPSCHMTRLLGVKEPPLKLLEGVTGLELVPFKNQDKCCGFGGTFSVKLGELSGAMAADKVDNLIASGADTIIGCDAGCLMNIKARLEEINHPMQVLHIANVLTSH